MFKYGIENLNKHLDLFKGKRVGLLTNPSGTDQNFRATVDILNEHTNLTALFHQNMDLEEIFKMEM